MSAQTKPRYTLEEYFELERKSEERYEYWNGEVFCMSGVSEEHAEIETNLIVSLKSKLRGRGCRVFPANMRIKVPSMAPYRYGDLSALCGEAQFEEIGGVDALTNPSLIVEVLSESTEAYDRGKKFTQYKSIPSFGEYLLVDQNRPHITHLVKQADSSWIYNEYNDLVSVVKLTSLNCELPMSEVYENVSFDSEKAE
ncbi:MAG TPA: Uma2 family endonuclease [Pyrinomonadaceae bacterium]|nr:Uma2 family endonuclease [Pyrinomonadaceae bacterium]